LDPSTTVISNSFSAMMEKGAGVAAGGAKEGLAEGDSNKVWG